MSMVVTIRVPTRNVFTIPMMSMATFLPQLYSLETNGSPYMVPYGKSVEVFGSIKAQ